MEKVELGTARWGAIWAKAESLRSEGKLNYVNLKVQASCGGDVAQRVIEALKATESDGDQASTVNTDEAAPPGQLPALLQARWDACALTQHQIAVEAVRATESEHAIRQTAELSRHHAEVRDLGVNLEAALGDVSLYSKRASDAEDKLEQSEAQIVELQDNLTDALARVAQAEADIDAVRGNEATAQAERTAASIACARAETEAELWHQRVETAEDALEKCRIALEVATNRVARLEGELDVGQRAHQEQRELLQSLTDPRHTRPTRTDAKHPTSGK